jgi:hypothetical protein
MTTLLAALERALATAATAPEPSSDVAPDDRGTPTSTSGSRSRSDWTSEDFALLLRDRRPSARRIVAVLDELSKQPDVEVPLSALAAAVGLSRGELRGAFAGLTHLCKQLRQGVEYDWPIIWREGASTQPGQASETWYHIPAEVAEQWSRTRRGPHESEAEIPR